MAVRLDRSLRRHIRENKEFIIQVQKCSDLDAAAAALRRAAEDVAALDGGWESAFGLSPGDTNGPTGVGVTLAPSGPLLGVDGGHTPEELLVTIPSLIVRRLEEAGVASAVLAVPPPSDTLVHLGAMPRAVVLRLYPPPPVCSPGQMQKAWTDAKLPDHWLDEAYAWLTSGRAPDDELWAQIQPGLELVVGVDEAEQLFRNHSGLLVAGKPPTPAPTRRAQAEGWTDEQRQADGLERMGGRVRAISGGRCDLTLATGGPDATDDDLRGAFSELRALARRLAPTAGYAFVTFSPTFAIMNSSSLHLRWSPQAPQSSPDGICDVVAFDAFHAQILGPGHLRRLRGVPPGTRELGGGRVELVVGEPTDWLPTLRDGGRRLLAPCLIGRGDERRRLVHQRHIGSISLSEAEARELERRLWHQGFPRRSIEELLADPEALIHFRGVALGRRPDSAASARPEEADFLTWAPPSGRRLSEHDLERPVFLHLHPVPPATIDDVVQLPDHLLQRAGAWVAAGPSPEVQALLGHRELRLGAADAPRLLALLGSPTVRRPAKTWVVASSADGRVRMAVVWDDSFAPWVTLISGRQPGRGHPTGSAAAEDEALGQFEELAMLARSAAADLGYAYVSFDDGPRIGFEAALSEELVVDAFSFQILGPGHLRRLGGPPTGARPLAGDRVELSIGQPGSWLLRVNDEGRRLLARCLVTESEAAAIQRARSVAGALAEAGMPQARENLACAGGPLDALPDAPRAVLARLHVALEDGGRELPDEWIEEAAAWVVGGSSPGQPLLAAVEHGMQLQLPPTDAAAFLERCARTRAWSAVLTAGDLDGTIRAVSVTGDGQSLCPQMALALGGPGSTDDELVGGFEALRAVARRLAPRAAYGSIDLEPDFRVLWGDVGEINLRAADHRSLAHAWETTVPDGFGFQILGPGHLGRLGSPPAGARDLGAGRIDVAVGEPGDWLLHGTHREDVRRRAREVVTILMADAPP